MKNDYFKACYWSHNTDGVHDIKHPEITSCLCTSISFIFWHLIKVTNRAFRVMPFVTNVDTICTCIFSEDNFYLNCVIDTMSQMLLIWSDWLINGCDSLRCLQCSMAHNAMWPLKSLMPSQAYWMLSVDEAVCVCACVHMFGLSWAQWGIVKQRALRMRAFEPEMWWRARSFDVFFKGLSSLGWGGWSSLMRRPTLDQVNFLFSPLLSLSVCHWCVWDHAVLK